MDADQTASAVLDATEDWINDLIAQRAEGA